MVRTAKVVTSTVSGKEHEVLVSDGDVTLHTVLRGVDVRLRTSLVNTARRVIRLNAQGINLDVEVTVRGSLATAPVDGTTSPFLSTLSTRVTSRPQTELNAARSLRVGVLTTGRVLGVLLVESAHGVTIDNPVDLVLLPVDGVLVVVFLGVAADTSTNHVVVVKLALPVVVALGASHVVTNELIVNLILDTRKKNEVRDDTSGATGLHLDGSLTVPEVVRRGDSRSTSTLVHLDTKAVVVTGGDVTEVTESRLSGVTEVVRVSSDTIGATKVVLALGVNRHGNTGSRLVRVAGIAATKTDVTVTASTIGRAAGVLRGASLSLTAGRNRVGERERKNCSSRNVAQHYACLCLCLCFCRNVTF